MAHAPVFVQGPVLGIETSCDETATAVVDDGRVLTSRVASQVPLHRRFGGVVPEIASRNHLLTILPTVQAALEDVGLAPADLAGVAVTNRPGLIGALLVGVQTARTLALSFDLPVVGVDHIAAHCWASKLRPAQQREPSGPALPFLALAVSGGHSSLLRFDGPESVQVLGQTLDDAAGEALDKFGKLLGLPYPAGPAIDRIAREGDPERFSFPRGMSGRDDLAMSFSGLKTAGRQRIEALRAEGHTLDGALMADLCASYQAAAVAQLVETARRAARQSGLREVVMAGGVAANSLLRARMQAMCAWEGLTLHAVALPWCMDNAAMVAGLGGAMLAARGGDDVHTLDAAPSRRPPPPGRGRGAAQ